MARGNNEGTINRRQDGRYEARITVGRTADGKQKRISAYGKTRKEAADKLSELLEQYRKGSLVAPHKTTFNDLLSDWLALKKGKVKPTTYAGYKNIVNRHLLPRLGPQKVQSLTVQQVELMYADLQAQGLSARMAQLIGVVLGNAMDQAVRHQLVSTNVVRKAVRPKPPKYRAAVWDGAQTQAFVQGTRAHPWHALYVLAILTGMRRGELLGLQWADVDWDQGRVTIRRSVTMASRDVIISTPKSEAGHRTIYLPEDALILLRQTQAAQAQQRAKAKSRWKAEGWVFTRPHGGHLKPVSVSQEFGKLTESLDLPRIRLHDLRHTNASLSIRQGVALKVVSARLGHATPMFTADVYQHVYDDMERAAALSLKVLTGQEDDRGG